MYLHSGVPSIIARKLKAGALVDDWPRCSASYRLRFRRATSQEWSRPAPDTPFRIGVMDSITGVGETYGNVAAHAKQMAADEINAAGGVNGRNLELVIEDSKCNAQDAITAFRKLTEVDGVEIILGTSCSGAMLGVAPLAEENGVILFSGLASNSDIANAGDYIFRTQISDIEVGSQYRQCPLVRWHSKAGYDHRGD